MFRYKVGARVLARNYTWEDDYQPVEVRILEKTRNHIKVEVLSGTWWKPGTILWLEDTYWYVSRNLDN